MSSQSSRLMHAPLNLPVVHESPRYDMASLRSIVCWHKIVTEAEATITHKDWYHQNHPLTARFSSRNQLQHASLPIDKYLDTLLGPNSSADIGHQRSEHNIDGQDILQRRRANQDHLGLPQNQRRFQRRLDCFVRQFCSIGWYRIPFFLDVGVCQEPYTNVSKRENF